MTRPTRRFDPSTWVRRLVPFLLVLLVLTLIAALVVIALSLAGFMPA